LRHSTSSVLWSRILRRKWCAGHLAIVPIGKLCVLSDWSELPSDAVVARFRAYCHVHLAGRKHRHVQSRLVVSRPDARVGDGVRGKTGFMVHADHHELRDGDID